MDTTKSYFVCWTERNSTNIGYINKNITQPKISLGKHNYNKQNSQQLRGGKVSRSDMRAWTTEQAYYNNTPNQTSCNIFIIDMFYKKSNQSLGPALWDKLFHICWLDISFSCVMSVVFVFFFWSMEYRIIIFHVKHAKVIIIVYKYDLKTSSAQG